MLTTHDLLKGGFRAKISYSDGSYVAEIESPSGTHLSRQRGNTLLEAIVAASAIFLPGGRYHKEVF